MPGIFNTFAPLLKNWGYLAVGGLVLVEDFGIPVPGETVLIAASIYAGNGNLNVVGVAAVAFCAAVLGDNIGYAIGRFGGHTLVERYGRYILLTPARVERAEGFFSRHGGKIVVVARFIEGLRQANGIIAGLSEMRWLSFLAFNAIGAALWVATWVSLGATAGGHIVAIYNWFTRIGLYALIILAVVIVALIVRHVRRRRAGRQPGPEPAAAGADAGTKRPEPEQGREPREPAAERRGHEPGRGEHAESDRAPAGNADSQRADSQRADSQRADREQGQTESDQRPAGHADSEPAESEQAER
jgi:membrane protein DedA with SNARE-associated domain